MIGTQIGPFLTLRLLGAGGMGSVYLAEHCLMKDLHAIKVLDPQLTQNPQIVTRFVNEARAAAKLRHRNLVRVHNIERLPDGGPWFMVLDYLEGHTLARFMAGHSGPIAPHRIVHILAQVASCIQHVHDHKIVHRDLKPDNIFLIQRDDDPQFPVVLDLGVAQLNEDLASGPATKTGTVIGTPIYMAPEQLRGERVSPAADVFALGVIAYEMSTGGFFPYQYDESRAGYFELPATEIYYRQRSAPAYDPRRRCPGLGEAWVHALGAALQLDPRARPASMQAFALLLADAVPAGDDHPDGPTIVRQVARELTQGRAERATSSPPAVDLARTAHPAAPRLIGDGSGPQAARELPADRTTLTEPVSTLDGAASQSVAGARAAQRWAKIAGGATVALVAGALASFAVIRWTAGDDRLATAASDHTVHVMAPPASSGLVVARAAPPVSESQAPAEPSASAISATGMPAAHPGLATSATGAPATLPAPATSDPRTMIAPPASATSPTGMPAAPPAPATSPTGTPAAPPAPPAPPAPATSAIRAPAVSPAPATSAIRAPATPPAPATSAIRAPATPAAPATSAIRTPAAPPAPATAATRVSSSSMPRPPGTSPGAPPPAVPRASLPGSTGARTPPPSVTTARKSGELAIIVQPWALIWLNGKSHGQTPFRENVAAGRYLVRIANDDAGKDESFTIIVNPDETTTVQRTWR